MYRKTNLNRKLYTKGIPTEQMGGQTDVTSILIPIPKHQKWKQNMLLNNIWFANFKTCDLELRSAAAYLYFYL